MGLDSRKASLRDFRKIKIRLTIYGHGGYFGQVTLNKCHIYIV